MTEIFRQTLTQLSQDRVLDRSDLVQLRQAAAQANAQAPGSADAQIAAQLMPQLDQIPGRTEVNFTLPAGQASQAYHFVITPTYAEHEMVRGSTPLEQVAQLSQQDALTETDSDAERCGAASLLNAYLLMGGRFADAAQSVGLLPQQRLFTYGNAHRVQERLFDAVNTNGRAGLTATYAYNVAQDGRIAQVWPEGEMLQGAERLGLRLQPLLGENYATRHQRHGSVEAFWQAHPQGVLQVGVIMDTATGAISPAQGETDQNHFVLVHRQGSQYVMIDSGQADNGSGRGARYLSPEEYSALVLYNPGSVNGLSPR